MYFEGCVLGREIYFFYEVIICMIWFWKFIVFKTIVLVMYRFIVINVMVVVLMWFSGVDIMKVFIVLGLVFVWLIVDGGVFVVLIVVMSMFLYVGIWYLLVNMVFFYFFGWMVEFMIGSWLFVILYGVVGVGVVVF